MKILLTLEACRINSGYTQKDVATLMGLSFKTIERYEKDSSRVPFDFIGKAESLYKIPKENIFFGNKYEFFNSLREGELN